MKTDIQCYHVQQALAVPRGFVRFAAAFIKQGDIYRAFLLSSRRGEVSLKIVWMQ